MTTPELHTEAEARAWLSDPRNWHESEVYVLRWCGLSPTVTRRIGVKLAAGEPSSLPAFVAGEQARMRLRGRDEEEKEATE